MSDTHTQRQANIYRNKHTDSR